MSPDGLAVLYVNYASHDLLRENLAPVDLSTVPAQVYIVDNFHSDQARDSVASLCSTHGWTLVAAPENLGFGAGMNLGAERALADGFGYLAMINPDAQVTDDALTTLLAAVRAEPMALHSPRILRPDGRPWFTGGTIDYYSGRVRARAATHRPPDWLTGACLLTSAGMWRRLGGFDPDYFLYWEDIDLSVRCVRSGGMLRVVDEVEVIHDPGGTQGPGSMKTPLYIYYNCRNPLVFAAKNLDPATARRWLAAAPRESWRIVLRGERRRPGHVLAGMVAAARGTAEGARWVRSRAAGGAPSSSQGSA